MVSRAKLTNGVIALLASLLLVCASLIYLSHAYGANTKDTEFHFDLGIFQDTAGTDARAKTNNSSVYVNIISKDIDTCTLHVDGKKNMNSTSYTDRTIGGKAVVKRAGQFRIRTLVYERGERACRLTAYKTSGSGKLVGVWSPDCAGSYPAMN